MNRCRKLNWLMIAVWLGVFASGAIFWAVVAWAALRIAANLR